jgi:hypothetical protein
MENDEMVNHIHMLLLSNFEGDEINTLPYFPNAQWINSWKRQAGFMRARQQPKPKEIDVYIKKRFEHVQFMMETSSWGQ